MLLIYLPVITPRCEFVFDMVFKEELGTGYQLTTDLQLFEAYQNNKINYSPTRNKEEFYIKATGLLFEHVIKEVDVLLKRKLGTTVLFASDASCDVGFDIFSAIFYMVSRYEEYLPFTPDKFGRYEGTESLAYKNKFLHKPVVNTWINIIREILLGRFPDLRLKSSTFNYLVTYDIDIAYAFKGRNFLRHLGATINDVIRLKFDNILLRFRSLNNQQKDPFDVYDLLQEQISKQQLSAIFFFLLADYSTYDKNISFRHPLMKALIRKVSAFSEIGLHPSFKTPLYPKKIAIEKDRLETLSGKKIEKSRQHYLRFTLPGTYNNLINAGIKEDYSMGFADVPGFRAGTCKPFYFYDLENEKATDLKIFPVTVMEGTFINYLEWSPEVALPRILKLLEEVKNVNGTFISIWHNHTLSETNMYAGWRMVHDKMIAQILSDK